MSSAPLDPSQARMLVDAFGDLPSSTALTAADRTNLALFFDAASFAPETEIVTEGGHERTLYLVLEGRARAVRHAQPLGVMASGTWFGQLEALTAMPAPFSVVAEEPLTLARLTFDRFRLLAETHSALATELETLLLGQLSERIVDRTHAPVSALPSAESRREVLVQMGAASRRVALGTRVCELLAERVDHALVVAALVDKKAVSLNTKVLSPCSIDALTTDHWEGQRVYRHSLALLALEAAARLDGVELRMRTSIGFAQRISVKARGKLSLPEFAVAVEAEMKHLADLDLPLEEELWSVPEAMQYFEEAGFREAKSLLTTWRDAAVPLARYGSVRVLNLGPLVARTGALRGFCVLADEEGLLVVYGPRASTRPLPSQTMVAVSLEDITRGLAEQEAARAADREFVAQQARQASHHIATMTLEEERWLDALGMSSVGEFNRTCVDGDVPQLIRVSEGFQEKRIGQIADRIAARPKLRVICIAGPSSAGKTTFIKRLSVQLRINGITPVALSLDDYYVDRARTPRTASSEYDYEALEALRLDLLSLHLKRLTHGESVRTAHYDFVRGESEAEGGPALRLSDTSVLLLEGIHGLNPRLGVPVGEDEIFRIFVCPLLQFPFDHLHRIHVSDVRLLRRIIRDRRSRGIAALENLRRWPTVRAGERKHIFPYQHHADAVFDTSLIYEPSVLKVFAERYLLEVPQTDVAHATAFRLAQLLDRFVAIYPDHVPPTSILREFIGGSGFEY